MNKKSIKKRIFLDNLNWESFLFLFFKSGIEKALVLDNIKFYNNIFKLILRIRGISIEEKSFFAGNLYNGQQKSLYLLALKITDKLAFKIADTSINQSETLDYLNKNFGNNTVRLSIAKNYKTKLNYWIIRGLTAKNLDNPETDLTELYIRDPIILKKENFQKIIDKLTYNFYNYRIKKLVFLKFFLLDTIKILIKEILSKLIILKNIPYNLNLNSILSMQEESIRTDQSLRNQFSWCDINQENKNFNSFVLLNNFFPNATKNNIQELRYKKKYILSQKIFRSAKKKYKKHLVRKLIKKEKRKILKALFKAEDVSQKYLFLHIINLLRYSDSLACLCLLLKTKVYLIKESQYISSDAIQMVSSFINVKTICIQFSNLARLNPMLMSTCDIFLIFSDNYKKLLKTKNIKPKKFIQTGYPINGIQNKLTDRVNKIRDDLNKENVSFVIGFFDESVSEENNKWGFIHPKNHLNDIHKLAKAVIEDNSLSVIVKNQFVSNDLNRIFPQDDLIRKAKETKRFINLSEGSHRNDIYPMQIALISDFCINYKFGATAGIESAITGTRTVLLDKFNYDTAHDKVYSKANVIYNDIDKLIEDIYQYRARKDKFKDIGDWSSIIEYFDPFTKKNNNSVERNYKIIESNFV